MLAVHVLSNQSPIKDSRFGKCLSGLVLYDVLRTQQGPLDYSKEKATELVAFLYTEILFRLFGCSFKNLTSLVFFRVTNGA